MTFCQVFPSCTGNLPKFLTTKEAAINFSQVFGECDGVRVEVQIMLPSNAPCGSNLIGRLPLTADGVKYGEMGFSYMLAN